MSRTLDKEVHACMTGSKKPKEATEEVVRAIDRIMRRLVRRNKRSAWVMANQKLAPVIKKETGVTAYLTPTRMENPEGANRSRGFCR